MRLLDVKDLHIYYGAIKAVKGITFHVDKGEIVALIGANGAGKTSTLRTITGLEKAAAGSIKYKDQELTKIPAHQIVKMGITHVPEGRRIFTNMTVRENLLMAALTVKEKGEVTKRMEEAFELFPRLKERIRQSALTLSGGEQQMLAVARAIVTGGELLLMDEPSMGLAPIIVDEIFEVIQRLNKAGTTILLVEQNAQAALSVANRGYVLETGKIVAKGTGAELLASPVIKRAYLGGEREEDPEKEGAYYF